MVIPGGFGERGSRARSPPPATPASTAYPCLGLCLGLQMMVIEFARNVAGMEGANSREFEATTRLPGHRPDGRADGCRATRAAPCASAPGPPSSSPARRWRPSTAPRSSTSATGTATRSTPATATASSAAGLRCSGTSPDDRLVEFIELPGHPFWVATQAHPEFKSRPDRPHPLFRGLVGAALNRAHERTPRLYDLDNVPS